MATRKLKIANPTDDSAADNSKAELKPMVYPAEQNGVKFPDKDPQLTVWNKANDAFAKKTTPLTLTEFVNAVGLDSMGAAALVGEYGRWKKYHSISGRLTSVKEKPDVQRTEKVKREKEVRNGVARPFPETKAGAIWELADEMSSLPESPVSSKDIMQAAAVKGYNLGNTASEYSLWRKFNGIVGRTSARKAETFDEIMAKVRLHEERAAKALTIANELRKKAMDLANEGSPSEGFLSDGNDSQDIDTEEEVTEE